MSRFLERFVFIGIGTFILCFFLNLYVVQSTKQNIHSDVLEVDKAYTAIVLGARVYQNGAVSTYLKNRLDKALILYNANKVERFLLSGDHGQVSYDEVNTMKQYLLDRGVPLADIFLDHAGFNTYNSIVRAKKVFGVEDAIIVSQDYHLNRALYIANKTGIEAQGFASNSEGLTNITHNKRREILARIKSFGEVLFAVQPKFLGPEIPITGSSFASHD